MFCPNCGNDCAEMKFCPMCGTKVPEMETAKKEQEDSYEIPYGKYGGNASNLVEFTKECLIVHHKPLFQKMIVAKIQYDQIMKVIYSRNEKEYGRLHFYWNDEGNERVISIGFLTGYDELGHEAVFHFFTVLKSLVPSTATFMLDIPVCDTSGIDFDAYFEKFSPYRRRAIKALSRERVLTREAATTMINTEFERRQMELYAAEPALAIRDLNRVIAERYRLYREYDRKTMERAILRGG